MNDKDRYIKQLENLIEHTLLPVFYSYYKLKGINAPELNLPTACIRKLPRLLEKQV